MSGFRDRARAGFSLLEILVATSMLAVALAALSQLASIGRQHLDASAKQANAARLATNQMARLAAGLDSLEDHDAEPLLEDPTWECQIQTLPVAMEGLVEARVSVRPASENALASAAQEKPWFTLARWIAAP